jgi:chromosome segregation ATPase
MRKLIPTTLILFGLAAAGCGGAELTVVETSVAELKVEVNRLDNENNELRRRLDGAERRLGGLSTDLTTVRNALAERGRATVGAESAPEGADVATGEGALAAASPELKQLLESEEGQKVLGEIVKKQRETQDAERRGRWVGSMVDRFAEEANLNADQTERLKDLHSKMMGDMRDAFTGMRDMGGSTEDRELARAEAMAQVGVVREKLMEDVKLVLDVDQYALYEEQASRFGRGGFGGGSRGGSRGGGRGGRGGGQ